MDSLNAASQLIGIARALMGEGRSRSAGLEGEVSQVLDSEGFYQGADFYFMMGTMHYETSDRNAQKMADILNASRQFRVTFTVNRRRKTIDMSRTSSRRALDSDYLQRALNINGKDMMRSDDADESDTGEFLVEVAHALGRVFPDGDIDLDEVGFIAKNQGLTRKYRRIDPERALEDFLDSIR